LCQFIDANKLWIIQFCVVISVFDYCPIIFFSQLDFLWILTGLILNFEFWILEFAF